MSSSDKNIEIWSTRLQRELLAMTAPATTTTTQDDLTAVLPPFCSVKDHQLDIERGDCTVMCWIDLPPSSTSPAAIDAVNQTTNTSEPTGKKEGDETDTATEKTEAGTTTAGEGSGSDDEDKKSEEEKKTESLLTPPVVEDAAPIIITLDVSLQKKPDGSINTMAVSYPFIKPIAFLTSGCERFPTGSTIQDGDLVGIEMDWTPSLHLADALLNISLKIKECLSQNEPFHPDTLPDKSSADAITEMMNRAKKLSASVGASVSEGLRGLNTGSPSKNEAAEGRKKKGLRLPPLLGRKKKENETEKAKTPERKAPTEVRIGDEINMLESPWVDCQGVYSCKPIRRPEFIAKAVQEAEKKKKKKANETSEPKVSGSLLDEDDQGAVPDDFADYMRAQASGLSQVANAGLAGAGAMLKSFTKSAKTVLEESFLMITDTHIIELRSNKLNLSTGTIAFAIPIEMLAKLKFRRQESISLFFKPALEDPLIYMCPDSADCVHQIQNVLKRHGVKGKHTNAATHRAINQALHLVQEIQTKELALKHDPSVERVNEIMDLYRQAAERFESAGDARHKEVVEHMRKFLALPLTVSILDGTYTKPIDDEPIASSAGVGIVLSSPSKDDGENSSANDEDKDFHDNMDNLLREAEEDLANMITEVEEDPELDAMIEEAAGGRDADDAIADFENMLKEADNELAELMNS